MLRRSRVAISKSWWFNGVQSWDHMILGAIHLRYQEYIKEGPILPRASPIRVGRGRCEMSIPSSERKKFLTKPNTNSQGLSSGEYVGRVTIRNLPFWITRSQSSWFSAATCTEALSITKISPGTIISESHALKRKAIKSSWVLEPSRWLQNTKSRDREVIKEIERDTDMGPACTIWGGFPRGAKPLLVRRPYTRYNVSLAHLKRSNMTPYLEN